MKAMLIIVGVMVVAVLVGGVWYFSRQAYNSPSIIHAGYDKQMKAKMEEEKNANNQQPN